MRGVKFLAVAAAVAMTISLAGCNNGKKEEPASNQGQQQETQAQDQADEPSDEAQDEAGVQYMDPGAITGAYQDRVSQRAVMDIVYNENEKYYEVKIEWGSSAKEYTQWVMTAYDDGDTQKLTYQDCSCDDITTEENGSFDSKNVYTNGSGELTINDDGTVTWLDDNGEEHIFEKMP